MYGFYQFGQSIFLRSWRLRTKILLQEQETFVCGLRENMFFFSSNRVASPFRQKCLCLAVFNRKREVNNTAAESRHHPVLRPEVFYASDTPVNNAPSVQLQRDRNTILFKKPIRETQECAKESKAKGCKIKGELSGVKQ